MRKRIVQVIMLPVIFAITSSLKTPPPEDTLEVKVFRAITTFYQSYPYEKIHLQFNKNKYAPGEDVWFKSYVLPLIDTSFATLSKIEYVELVDMHNNLVTREVLPVENGVSEGHFKLGAAFNEGIYHIRAYTAWMLNFDTAFFFNRDIPVFKISSTASNYLPGKNYTLRFYPEGGSLVSGLTSLVAYKAEDENGNPLKLTGKITDSKGAVKALLHTGDDGLGSFILHPLEGDSYSATTELSNGITKIFSLPEIRKSGIVLHVVDKPDTANNSQLFFHIARSKFEKELYGHILVCAHTAKYNRLMNINFDTAYAGDYKDTILVAADPVGLNSDEDNIAHITIFNNNGEPLADRMIFLHNKNSMPGVSLQPVSINANGKNEFALQVPQDNGGSYSVSVTQAGTADSIADNDENNIYSDFYLPGIQNYLYNPGRYFQNDTKEARHQLDLLMLTSGWNHFDWHKIINNNFPVLNFRPEQTLSLKGSVIITKGNKKEPYTDSSLALMMRSVRDSINTFLTIPVSGKGDFVESGLFFHDTASFFYQNTTQKRNKEVAVTFDKNETDSVLQLPFYYKPYKNATVSYIAAAPISTVPMTNTTNDSTLTLKSVTVTTKIKTRIDSLDEVYTSGLFSGTRNFSKTFDLTDDNIAETDHTNNVLQYLQGRVPGLNIQGDLQNTPEIYWRATSGSLLHNQAVDPVSATILNMPVFFIDQRQINSNQLMGGSPKEQLSPTITQLAGIRLADIAIIKVYEPGTFYGSEGGAAHGAIAIYLKRGNSSNPAINVNRIVKQGFSFVPSFVDNVFNGSDKQAIYWNPDVHTDTQTHTATISFTNNTGAKRIRIVVEGVDRKGRLCRIEKIFEQ